MTMTLDQALTIADVMATVNAAIAGVIAAIFAVHTESGARALNE